METIYTFLADGFEEIEAITVIDVLKRANLSIKTVSVMGTHIVAGAHDILVVADSLFEKTDFSDAKQLILPGGMPGADTLSKHEGLNKLIISFMESDKPVAAICAAPMVLGKLGLLKGRKATAYPGFEHHLAGAIVTGALVQTDRNLITGQGPGAAMDFAFAIVEALLGEETVAKLKAGMIVEG